MSKNGKDKPKYYCPHCGLQFSSPGEVAAHSGHCPNNQ